MLQSIKLKQDGSHDDLVFVNLTHPDDVKQRTIQHSIRSRVMKGIGRSRRTRRKQPDGVTFSLEKVPLPTGISTATSNTYIYPKVQIPNPITSWPFPVVLD